jgi:hypothetical protein
VIDRQRQLESQFRREAQIGSAVIVVALLAFLVVVFLRVSGRLDRDRMVRHVPPTTANFEVVGQPGTLSAGAGAKPLPEEPTEHGNRTPVPTGIASSEPLKMSPPPPLAFPRIPSQQSFAQHFGDRNLAKPAHDVLDTLRNESSPVTPVVVDPAVAPAAWTELPNKVAAESADREHVAKEANDLREPRDPSAESDDAEDLRGELMYITEQGDTLFSIAAEQLGQASRFVEVLQLNREILPAETGSATPLAAGLPLKLPK